MEETTKERTLREELLEIKDMVREGSIKKSKKRDFKIPFKAKLNSANLKRGFLTIAIINDNKSLDFTKEPIIDGTIKLGESYHAIEDFDIFTYKGKPFIFQPKSKLNPYNPLQGENETYGQSYVMARMEGDKIMGKKKMGLGVSIGVIIIVGIIAYALITG